MKDRRELMNDDRSRAYAVKPPQVGQTIAAALRIWESGLSWKAVRDQLHRRLVVIDGVTCQNEARRLHLGEVVEVVSRPRPAPPKASTICVRFLDGSIAVVEKPAGILTERPAADFGPTKKGLDQTPSLEELLPKVLREYEGRSAEGSWIQIVHRLDRDASGLLVIARTTHAHDELVQQFAARTPSRVYGAIVPGRVEAQTIRSHILRDRGDGKRGSLEFLLANNPGSAHADVYKHEAQEAITHVTPLASRRGHTWLECRLETGRTNQIRIHLAELGHPILGDVKYGSLAAASKTNRLALHAVELRFQHPATGDEMHFVSEWPSELQRLWDELPMPHRRWQ